MTRPHLCDFCHLSTPAVRQIRHKRLRRLVWVCADPKHLGRTATLTKRQRGIVADRMIKQASGF